jgi:ubiquinone/menaquinone biosynthesis C-methylase UbiE
MKKWYSSKLWTKIYARFICSSFSDDPKKREEIAHWIGESLAKKDNNHFEYFYCKEFGYSKEHFQGKSLLDIGCGPSGSLEWADGAKKRVGIDPLAKEYLCLGAWKQKMKYVACGTEKMPFADSEFDVVFTFNALDHVDDLDVSMREIFRVLKPCGDFICITDCNHAPTITEPTFIPIDFVERYFAGWRIKDKEFFKHTRLRIYDSLFQERVPIDPTNAEFSGSCILKIHATKPSN